MGTPWDFKLHLAIVVVMDNDTRFLFNKSMVMKEHYFYDTQNAKIFMTKINEETCSICVQFEDFSEVSYIGGWKNGNRHGFGSTIYACGTLYTGNYRKGKRDGHGNVKWPDGSSFFGTFRQGTPFGLGVMKYNSGAQYLGNFCGYEICGEGYVEFDFPPNGYYHGYFDAASQSAKGQGCLRNQQGFIFMGNFENGMLQGNAEVLTPEGYLEKYTFQNGEIVTSEEVNQTIFDQVNVSLSLPLSPEGKSPRRDEEAKDIDVGNLNIDVQR